jgi:hypothetical protein
MQSVRLRAPAEEDQALKTDHPEEEIGVDTSQKCHGNCGPQSPEGLDTATTFGDLEERQLNFMLAVIKEIKPRDQLMAMLGS